MELIDKSVLVSEIERRIKSTNNDVEIGAIESLTVSKTLNSLISFIETLEVKEVDLKKEFNKYFFNFTDPETGEKLKRKECWLDIKQARKLAKHFFELGLKVNQKGE